MLISACARHRYQSSPAVQDNSASAPHFISNLSPVAPVIQDAETVITDLSGYCNFSERIGDSLFDAQPASEQDAANAVDSQSVEHTRHGLNEAESVLEQDSRATRDDIPGPTDEVSILVDYSASQPERYGHGPWELPPD
jgi:hypothetical protein